MYKFFPPYLRVLLIMLATYIGLELLIDSGNKPAFIAFPIVSLFLIVVLFLLIVLEIVLFAVSKVSYTLLSEEDKKRKEEQDSIPAKMPKWFLFLLVIVAITSLGGFVFNEMSQPKPAIPIVINAETVTALTDAKALASGKTIFETNCASCHKPDAGGLIGPNLTDQNWINGGGIKNIYKTISEGSKNNAMMISWKATLKPNEIQAVASYVLSLQGTNPVGAKAAEGEVWTEK